MSLSFLSKSNPLISNVKKGKFLTPWFLAPFILYYITQYMSPVSRASTNFFLDKQNWIPDWWNILDLWTFGPSSTPLSPSSFGSNSLKNDRYEPWDSLEEMAFPNSLKVCWWVPS